MDYERKLFGYQPKAILAEALKITINIFEVTKMFVANCKTFASSGTDDYNKPKLYLDSQSSLHHGEIRHNRGSKTNVYKRFKTQLLSPPH